MDGVDGVKGVDDADEADGVLTPDEGGVRSFKERDDSLREKRSEGDEGGGALPLRGGEEHEEGVEEEDFGDGTPAAAGFIGLCGWALADGLCRILGSFFLALANAIWNLCTAQAVVALPLPSSFSLLVPFKLQTRATKRTKLKTPKFSVSPSFFFLCRSTEIDP